MDKTGDVRAKNILFLDDNEERQRAFVNRHVGDEVTIVATASDAIYSMQGESWDEVWLDHDLGGKVFVNSDREDCGMEVVRWMCAYPQQVSIVYVHTWNVPAGKEMFFKLYDAGYKVTRTMFGGAS